MVIETVHKETFQRRFREAVVGLFRDEISRPKTSYLGSLRACCVVVESSYAKFKSQSNCCLIL